MAIIKPQHSKYMFSNLDADTYRSYVEVYSTAKRYGLRGIYAWASGVGILGIVKDLIKGKIIRHGKKKLVLVIFNTAGYVLSPLVCVLTNVSYVVNGAKRVHSICGFVFECLEDSANLSYLPIDLFLFGQPVTIKDKHRFDFFDKFSNIFDND
jgi:hypothetical protein